MSARLAFALVMSFLCMVSSVESANVVLVGHSDLSHNGTGDMLYFTLALSPLIVTMRDSSLRKLKFTGRYRSLTVANITSTLSLTVDANCDNLVIQSCVIGSIAPLGGLLLMLRGGDTEIKNSTVFGFFESAFSKKSLQSVQSSHLVLPGGFSATGRGTPGHISLFHVTGEKIKFLKIGSLALFVEKSLLEFVNCASLGSCIYGTGAPIELFIENSNVQLRDVSRSTVTLLGAYHPIAKVVARNTTFLSVQRILVTGEAPRIKVLLMSDINLVKQYRELSFEPLLETFSFDFACIHTFRRRGISEETLSSMGRERYLPAQFIYNVSDAPCPVATSPESLPVDPSAVTPALKVWLFSPINPSAAPTPATPTTSTVTRTSTTPPVESESVTLTLTQTPTVWQSAHIGASLLRGLTSDASSVGQPPISAPVAVSNLFLLPAAAQASLRVTARLLCAAESADACSSVSTAAFSTGGFSVSFSEKHHIALVPISRGQIAPDSALAFARRSLLFLCDDPLGLPNYPPEGVGEGPWYNCLFEMDPTSLPGPSNMTDPPAVLLKASVFPQFARVLDRAGVRAGVEVRVGIDTATVSRSRHWVETWSAVRAVRLTGWSSGAAENGTSSIRFSTMIVSGPAPACELDTAFACIQAGAVSLLLNLSSIESAGALGKMSVGDGRSMFAADVVASLSNVLRHNAPPVATDVFLVSVFGSADGRIVSPLNFSLTAGSDVVSHREMLVLPPRLESKQTRVVLGNSLLSFVGSHACVIDSMLASANGDGTLAGHCDVPVPQVASTVEIAVQRSICDDRSAAEVSVSLLLAPVGTSRDPVLVDEWPCLSQDKEIGVHASGDTSNCSRFLHCGLRKVPIGVDAVRLAVRISAPNARIAVCDFAFLAFAKFAALPRDVVWRGGSATEFFCGDGTKIAVAQVCDGVSGCSGGEDEASCNGFRQLHWRGEFRIVQDRLPAAETVRMNIKEDRVETAVATAVMRCRRSAAFRQAPMIEIVGPLSQLGDISLVFDCSIFEAVSSARFFTEPSVFIEPDPARTALIFARLPGDDVRRYKKCTARLHCSGNGKVTDGAGSCSCQCTEHYVGSRCHIPLPTGDPGMFFALFVLPNRGAIVNFDAVLFADAVYDASSGAAVDVTGLVPVNASVAAVEFSFLEDVYLSPRQRHDFARRFLETSLARALSAHLELRGFGSTTRKARDNSQSPETVYPWPIFATMGADRSGMFIRSGQCISAGADNSTSGFSSASGMRDFQQVRCLFASPGWSPDFKRLLAHKISRLRFDIGGMTSFSARVITEPNRDASVKTNLDLRCEYGAHGVLAWRRSTDIAGCPRLTCIVDLSSLHRYQPSDVHRLEVDTATRCLGWEGIAMATISVMQTSVLPPITTNVSLSASNNDFLIDVARDRDMLVVALAAGAVGILCVSVLAAIRYHLANYRAMRMTRGLTSDGGVLPAQVTRNRNTSKQSDRWALWAALSTEQTIQHRRLAACIVSTLGLVALLLSGQLLVFYDISASLTAKYTIIVAHYHSPLCEGHDEHTTPAGVAPAAALRTLPYAQARLPATAKCVRLEYAGDTAMDGGPLFGRAMCTRGRRIRTGNVFEIISMIRLFRTESECTADTQNLVAIRPADCVRRAAVVGGDGTWTASRFLRIHCVQNWESSRLASSMLALLRDSSDGAPPVAFQDGEPSWPTVNVMSVPVSRQISHAASSDNSSTALTDSEGTIILAVGTELPESDVSNRASELFVQQGPASFYSDSLNTTSPTENDGDLTPVDVPADGIPASRKVGVAFGGYAGINASRNQIAAERTGVDASLAAAEVCDISGSQLDLGKDFSEDCTSCRASHAGATISFWIRASPRTEGFAVVVADHFVDRPTRSFIVAERLQRVIMAGPGENIWHASPGTSSLVHGPTMTGLNHNSELLRNTAGSWFANESSPWNTYASVHLSGRARRIQFAAVLPVGRKKAAALVSTESREFINAVWQLDSLHSPIPSDIFNGEWHHLAVTLGNENDFAFAWLVVDGRSDRAGVAGGWRQCLGRRLVAVSMALQAHKTVAVESSMTSLLDAEVFAGASTHVGLLNAALYAVRIESRPSEPSTFVRRGTRSMRIFAADTKVPVLAAAAWMIFGIVAGLMLAVFYGRRVVNLFGGSSSLPDNPQKQRLLKQSAVRRYQMLCESGCLFGRRGGYSTPSLDIAAATMKLDPAMMGPILDCFEAAPYASAEDARDDNWDVLFQARVGKFGMSSSGESPAKNIDAPKAPLPRFAFALWALWQTEKHPERVIPLSVPSPEEWEAELAVHVPSLHLSVTGRLEWGINRGLDKWTGHVDVPSSTISGQQGAECSSRGKPVAANIASASNAHVDPSDMAGFGVELIDSFRAALSGLQTSGVYLAIWGGTLSEVYVTIAAPFFGVLSLDLLASVFQHPLTGPLLQLWSALFMSVASWAVLLHDDANFFLWLLRYQCVRDNKDQQLPPSSNYGIHHGEYVTNRIIREASCQKMSRSAGSPGAAIRSLNYNLGPGGRSIPSAHLSHRMTGQVPPGMRRQRRDALAFALHRTSAVSQTGLQSRCNTEGSLVASAALECEVLPVWAATAVWLDGKTMLKPQPFPAHGLARIAAASTSRVSPHAADTQKPPSKLPLFCPVHGRWLAPIVASDITPFDNRSRCAIVGVGGVSPCLVDIGRLWRCPHSSGGDSPCCAGNPTTPNVRSRVGKRCTFTICDRHAARGAGGLRWFAIRLVGRFRSVIDEPILDICCGLILLASFSVYLPICRSSLLILVCSPQYRCIFDGCWWNPDASFAAAAFIAGAVFVLFGIGFPASLVIAIARRTTALHEVFRHPSYDGRYIAKPPPSLELLVALAREQRVAQSLAAQCVASIQLFRRILNRRKPIAEGEEFTSLRVPMPEILHTPVIASAGRNPEPHPIGVTTSFASVPSVLTPADDSLEPPAFAGPQAQPHTTTWEIQSVTSMNPSLIRLSNQMRPHHSAGLLPKKWAHLIDDPPPALDSVSVLPVVVTSFSANRAPGSCKMSLMSASNLYGSRLIREKCRGSRATAITSANHVTPAVRQCGGDSCVGRGGSRKVPQSVQQSTLLVSLGESTTALGLSRVKQIHSFNALQRQVLDFEINPIGVAFPLSSISLIKKPISGVDLPISWNTEAALAAAGSMNRQIQDRINVDGSDDVAEDEWCRFLLADSSALSVLYRSLRMTHWQKVPASMVMGVLLILPAVIFPSDSPQQFAGIFGTISIYTPLMLTIGGQRTPVLPFVSCLAAVHELLIAGTHAISFALAQNIDVSDTAGRVMVMGTIAYLFSLISLLVLVMSGRVAQRATVWQLRRRLAAARVQWKHPVPIYLTDHTLTLYERQSSF